MERSYRIKANVGKDQVLNVNLKQNIDLYEVLSLELTQEKIYKLHSSDYGVIVGRVLANDAFGIPNAKVSVFIPISDEDKLRSDIKEMYPYYSVNSHDNNNIRFNTLPDYVTKECHKPVGTFSNKRLVLDEDLKLEIYDKYYKFTTVTNNSGDYMIFGVHVGKQIIHVDIDLSDIGVLSQRPTDFIYKGYNVNLFESPSEFKVSTNLNELPQIISEDVSVNVYPFWGDKDENEIAITRKDVRIQYKFEPTCVFLGSVMTDSSVNSISHDCTPSAKMGEASQLVPSEGTIEMIRKTIDDKVEEVNIKGNQLIDGDGVFCYQIPMNLDYVCTDEYGNITPTDNPNKGIPTRARVRFRITLNESGDDTLSSHKARYLIPNNPKLKGDKIKPFINEEYFNNEKSHYYDFGTLTNDECFRDLLWNKVYSVKSYIPRIQKPFGPLGEKSPECIAIKGVNKKDASSKNPLPFNKLNLNFSIPAYYIIKRIWDAKNDDGYDVRRFWKFLNGNQLNYNIDAIREKILEEMDGVGLDFYNDWLNGCLYFPNWYWLIKTKKNTNDSSKYDSRFCNCDKNVDEDSENKLCILNNCSLPYSSNELSLGYTDMMEPGSIDFMYTKMTYGSKQFKHGIIKKMVNKDGAVLYYYSFGQPCADEERDQDESGNKYINYVRLFATDIILLGSLNDCDIHGVPKVSENLPSTTSVIPPISTFKENPEEESENEEDEVFDFEKNKSSVNGMSWGEYWFRKALDGDKQPPIEGGSNRYKYYLSSGLFFGLTQISRHEPKTSFWDWVLNILPGPLHFGTWLTYIGTKALINALWGSHEEAMYGDFVIPFTDVKSCINAERICELGVTNDSDIIFTKDDGSQVKSFMDGLITKKELFDIDTRALFATLNGKPLVVETETDATGYKTYNLFYSYPVNFDGRLETYAPEYTDSVTHDKRNKDYIDFRMGSISNDVTVTEGYTYGGIGLGGTRSGSLEGRVDKRIYISTTEIGSNLRHFYGDSNDDIEIKHAFPLYDNSFYFYFGLNPAHTAISEFYKNFAGKCNVNKKDPFILKIKGSESSYCGSNGEINVTVNGASLPYSIIVNDSNGNKVTRKDDIYVEEEKISGIKNGKYTVIVIDAIEQEISEEITLSQDKIYLDYSIVSNIRTKYSNNKEEICNNKQYGIIRINNIKNNGATTYITEIMKLEESETKVSFLLNTGDILSINEQGNNNIDDYYCDCDGEKKEIYIGRPGNFILTIQDAMCQSNVEYYSIIMSDSTEIELYVNTMPLKFFIGTDKNDTSKYSKHFYAKGGYSDETKVSDFTGWFGVHDPKTYDKSFYEDVSDYKDIWDKENMLAGGGSTVKTKYNMLLNISSAVYVTNGSKNKFSVTATGDNVLIRSAYPNYDKFEGGEQKGTFKSYITCNVSETNENGVNNNPNIISENYTLIDSDGRIIGSAIESGYNFNPKYNGAPKNCGNYFAGFSNNANYIGKCDRANNGKMYMSLPFGADDLSKDKLCTGDDSKGGILEKVYAEPPYFRTEFIDRRLDYDFIYVTPCMTSNPSIWSNGRLSGITYNGIELLYDSQYGISSKSDSTEYNYDPDKGTITLNNDAPKMLYKSEFKYGGTRVLDLRELYYSKKRKEISEDTINNDGIKVRNHKDDELLNGDEFDNFGISEDKTKVLGYPTKRLLDIYNIPYGKGQYEWNGISCLYPKDIKENSDLKALPAEEVSFKLDFSNIVDIKVNQAEYEVSENNIFSCKSYKINFKVNASSVNGFFIEVKSIKFISDDSEHTFMNSMKTGDTIQLNGTEYISQLNNQNGIAIEETVSGDSFVGVGINYSIRNNTNDCLLKRTSVFDLSNYFNVGDIKFSPDGTGTTWHEKVESSIKVDANSIVIDDGKTGETPTVESDPTGSFTTEKFKFELSSSTFTFDDIEKIELGVTLDSFIKYTPVIYKFGNTGNVIKLSVTQYNNKSIENQDAEIRAEIYLKNKMAYVIPFKIKNDGTIY